MADAVAPIRSTSSDQDRVWVAAALEGSQKAYTALVTKYRRGLRQHIMRTVNNPREADDLVQEAFIKAFKNLDSYSATYAFSTWLYRIASNHAIDFLRKRRLATVSLQRQAEPGENPATRELPCEEYRPDRHIIEDQRRLLIQQAIDKLSPKYRRVIVLRHQNERSYQEIAEELDLPLGTVKAHIFRARKQLYKLLRDRKGLI